MRQAIDKHNINGQDQIIVLLENFRRDLNSILPKRMCLAACVLAFHCDNIGTKNLLSNVNIVNRYRTVLYDLLSDDVLEVLNSGETQTVIESTGNFGGLVLLFSEPLRFSLTVEIALLTLSLLGGTGLCGLLGDRVGLSLGSNIPLTWAMLAMNFLLGLKV